MAIAGSDESGLTATVRVSPSTVVLDVSRSSVTMGETLRAEATVTNHGAGIVRDVIVELRLDPDGLIVRQDRLRAIGRIKGGRSTSVSWRVCAAAPGSYVLLAQATADGTTVESDASIVSVAHGGRRSC